MDQLTLGVYKQLKQAKEVFMRTQDHPLTAELMQEVPALTFFDEIYEKHDQFDQVYQEITEILFSERSGKKTLCTQYLVIHLWQKRPYSCSFPGRKSAGLRCLSLVDKAFIDATFNLPCRLIPFEGLDNSLKCRGYESG
ncbi:hypothetical protein [Bacillus safensis FO-36b] [Bacillus safensis subsp. safensis]